MLKLKLQYFGHQMWQTDSLDNTLMLGNIEGGRRRGGWDRGWDGWMASPTQQTWVWASSRSWWWTGRPGVLQSMGSQRVGHNWVSEPTDWTVPSFKVLLICFLLKHYLTILYKITLFIFHNIHIAFLKFFHSSCLFNKQLCGSFLLSARHSCQVLIHFMHITILRSRCHCLVYLIVIRKLGHREGN